MLQRAYLTLVLLLFVFMLVAQMDIGLADNGDFARYMGWYATRPMGFPDARLKPKSDLWNRRYFHAYLPYWRAGRSGRKPEFSSAELFWLPGVILNRLLVSREVLYFPLVTFPLRVALVLLFWMILRRLQSDGAGEAAAVPAFVWTGLALAFMWADTRYIVYLNSFYREYAAFLTAMGLAICMVGFRRAPRSGWCLALVLSAGLLAANRPSYAACGVWIPLFVYPSWKRLPRKWLWAMVFGASVFLPAVAIVRTTPEWAQGTYRYSSLFDGALYFSRRPEDHLHRLGWGAGRVCVGHTHPSFPHFSECLPVYRDRVGFRHTLGVYLREPAAFWRGFRYALTQLSNFRVPFGYHRLGDPTAHKRREWLQAWSRTTNFLYPGGAWMVLLLGAYGVLFEVARRRAEAPAADVGWIGLAALAACVMDTAVTLLGNGKTEMIRTLYLSRVWLDIATIAAGYLAFWWAARAVRRPG